MPKTNFSKGINKGKLQAKEFSGIMLIMAAILQSKEGRRILKGSNANFREDWLIDDWAMMVETMLQWEAFLKLPEMKKIHVHALEEKHRFIMYLLKKVARRVKGMGMKFLKFHQIVHLAQDIMNFGVPMMFDTGCNESHHKLTKVAAHLTQQNIEHFEGQTAQRLVEFLALDLAMEELNGRAVWDYFDGYLNPHPPRGAEKMVQHPISTGGTQIEVFQDPDSGKAAWKFTSEKRKYVGTQAVRWDPHVQEFLLSVQSALSLWIEKVEIRTEHKRDGHIFRAHPSYRGGDPWNDWVMVNWGDEGEHPCEIWCFIDLNQLPEGVVIHHFDGTPLKKGVYALVENADYVVPDNEEDDKRTELFAPMVKEFDEMSGRRLYLAPVSAFVEPIVVIPDIDRESVRHYFHVTARKEWSGQFTDWLEQPHELDEMDDDYVQVV